MSLYSMWKLAWRRENPERYAPGLIKNTIPSKEEKEPSKKKAKEEKKNVSSLSKKENVKVIGNPEIKQIEKK